MTRSGPVLNRAIHPRRGTFGARILTVVYVRAIHFRWSVASGHYAKRHYAKTMTISHPFSTTKYVFEVMLIMNPPVAAEPVFVNYPAHLSLDDIAPFTHAILLVRLAVFFGRIRSEM